MNKAELVEAVQKALGKDVTKRAADEAVDAVLDSIAKGVKKDKKVQIIGFGTFEVKKRAARQGRNPKTGDIVAVAAKRVPFFKVGKELKQRVDRDEQHAPPAAPASASMSSASPAAQQPHVSSGSRSA